MSRTALLSTVLAATLAAAVAPADIHSPWTREKSKPDTSQGAFVAQVVGVDTWVQIAYHRPAVRDRNVWEDVGGNGTPIVPRDGSPPWRAGANEVTTIEFSGPVQVEGLDVPAGKYALFMIPGEQSWTVIFNEDTAQRGSGGQYDPEKDALRFDVVPQRGPKHEHLTYEFTNCEAWSTVAWLRWDRMHVPFEIEVRPSR